jgi:membrane protease YdiL (CAAX protease family)
LVALDVRDWRVAIVLGALGAVATACVFPYLLAMMPEVAARMHASRVPFPVVVAAQLAQAFVVLTLCAWIGLGAGRRVGLDAPLLRAWLHRMPTPQRPGVRDFRRAVGLGIAAAVLIALADLGFAPHMPPAVGESHAPAAWQGLIASFYGGVTEEIELRVLVMGVAAWALAALRGVRGDGVPAWIYWSAIVLAALLFAAGHLPLAIKLLGSAPIVIVRTLALNFPAGVVFGWLYWKRGLEHAMVSHFAADIVLHVLVPLAFAPR